MVGVSLIWLDPSPQPIALEHIHETRNSNSDARGDRAIAVRVYSCMSWWVVLSNSDFLSILSLVLPIYRLNKTNVKHQFMAGFGGLSFWPYCERSMPFRKVQLAVTRTSVRILPSGAIKSGEMWSLWCVIDRYRNGIGHKLLLQNIYYSVWLIGLGNGNDSVKIEISDSYWCFTAAMNRCRP